MKKLIVLFVALISFCCLDAQIVQPVNSTLPDKVYTVVQQRPLFRGDINKWLTDNIVYPADARRNNIQGTVYVSFIIEKDGSVSTPKVLRGVNKSLDDESVRVISMMPRWTPGMQNGQTVRVAYMVPIHFMLDNTTTPPPAQSKQ